ncbi:MAG: hypothetical protein OXG15_06320 [Gammaproteobacteria bacterium]|nr:hypothetical protein [Gammaproteobacteria bacterium]
MATAYVDAINGQPLTITIDAVAWAQPVAARWWTCCRQLNRLLGKSTHLLCIPASDKTEPIWYAGVAGTSLAGGIERMAIDQSELRESIVAFPLDTRVYVANVQKGLVREEWVLYPEAFENRIQIWCAEGRDFTVLTGGGRLTIDLPNATQLPVDIDTTAMTFQHASVALLRAGLLRWRDCLTGLFVISLAMSVSFALAWWHRTPSIDTLQRVAALVTQPAAPVHYKASEELAKLAMVVAEHDAALWHAEGATNLTFEAAEGALVLNFANGEPIRTSIEPLPVAPDVVAPHPFKLKSFQEKIATHMESTKWTVTFGDPYPIGTGTELEQHVTVSIGNSDDARGSSVAAALVDLSERLVRLPITLYEANCSVSEGVVNACEMRLAIRGSST